jgi:23S rRNA (uracil1939-C5)-methyltransferase
MARKHKIYKDVLIETLAAEGKCLTRIEGLATFVEGVAPGDVVDLKVIRKRKSYQEAVVLQTHQLSARREEPFCAHFGLCGGCKWQHIPYTDQLQYKQQQVIDSLVRIGKIDFPAVQPIIPSAAQRFYRNKLEFTFSDKKWLNEREILSDHEIDRRAVGFHIPRRFDKIVDVQYCHLQPEPSNDIRNRLRQFALENNLSFYNVNSHTGLLRNLIVRTASTGHTMVTVQFGANDADAIHKVMQHLVDEHPGLHSYMYVVNEKKNETFYDLDVVCYAGEPFIVEKLCGLSFKIGPKSFFQTNTAQAEALYAQVVRFARLSGKENVFDLYTGTGTIALCLAGNAGSVLGIESVAGAIDDARENARLNNIDNARFLVGDMKDALSAEVLQQYGRPDVVITDPPRAGMHADVVHMLLQLQARRIVYVSCNPATQARDLSILNEKYAVDAVQPVDMFPHTHHVENIVSLQLR